MTLRKVLAVALGAVTLGCSSAACRIPQGERLAPVSGEATAVPGEATDSLPESILLGSSYDELEAEDSYPWWSPGHNIAAAGGFVYNAPVYYELEVFDVSNPANPVMVDSYDDFDVIAGIAAADGYVYVLEHRREYNGQYLAVDWTGLVILDMTNPAKPVSLGTYPTMEGGIGLETWSIDAAGNLVYLAGAGGLHVIDVSSPHQPVQVGKYAIAEGWGVTVADDYAYLTTTGITVVDDYTYSTGDTELHIIDVTNPANPVSVGIYTNTGRCASKAAVAENHVYLLCQSYVRILNVSNPLHPIEITSLKLPPDYVKDSYGRGLAKHSYGQGLAIAGNKAYIVSNTVLYIADVTDPSAPVLLGAPENKCGRGFAVTVDGARAYTFGYGLCIFQ